MAKQSFFPPKEPRKKSDFFKQLSDEEQRVLASEASARAWLLAHSQARPGVNFAGVGQMVGMIRRHYPAISISPALLRLSRRAVGT